MRLITYSNKYVYWIDQLSYLSGADEDEISKKFLEVLNEADISSKLKKANAVCIKIQNGTESCTQFSQIYPVILVPSIYFIDSQSGTNIETTGGSAEKDKLLQSIEKALEYQPINTAAALADRLVFVFYTCTYL